MQRLKIHEDLLIRLQKTDTVEEVGLMLTEIQQLFGFQYYCVFDTSRLDEGEPISFLFPSNVPAAVSCKIEERLTNFVAQLSQHLPGTLGAMPWNIIQKQAIGEITAETAEMFRASGITMGISFPALGISSWPRLIGFLGDRACLDIDEIEQLNVLVFHLHVRLGIIGHAKNQERQPLSGLEKQVLFLALDGDGFDVIAEKIGLSSITISYLVSSICSKMEVATFEHAVAVTLRRGLAR